MFLCILTIGKPENSGLPKRKLSEKTIGDACLVKRKSFACAEGAKKCLILAVIIDEGKIRRKSKAAMGLGGAFPSSEEPVGRFGRRVKLSPTAKRAEKMRFIVGYVVLATGILAFIALLHLVITQGGDLPQSMAKASVKLSGKAQGVKMEDMDITFIPKNPVRADPNKEGE